LRIEERREEREARSEANLSLSHATNSVQYLPNFLFYRKPLSTAPTEPITPHTKKKLYIYYIHYTFCINKKKFNNNQYEAKKNYRLQKKKKNESQAIYFNGKYAGRVHLANIYYIRL
jgi:hypothetical protein